MRSIKFGILNIKKNFQNAKELKSSFITSIIGMCINNIAFIIMWYYFGVMVGNLNGWEPFDIFGLYGFHGIAYSLVCVFLYGLFNLPRYISSGNLDKFLLTPKNTLLKIITSDISVSAIGDLIFGIICFVIYAIVSKFTFIQIMFSMLLMILSAIIFFSFSLLCMSISFYLMDGSNVSEGFYGMFLSASMYHGGAFTGILKIIFTFVVPSLLVGAIPAQLVKNFSWVGVGFIITIALAWFAFSVIFFYKSLKKYESNNFFGFGG